MLSKKKRKIPYFMLRTFSAANMSLENCEPLLPEDKKRFKLLNVKVDSNGIYIDLKPTFTDILHKPDLKPAKAIIEDDVEFFMVRSPTGHSRSNVERGLYVEKAFDLMLGDIGVPRDYADAIRDWRMLRPCEFYVPMLGQLEVKSVARKRYNGKRMFYVNIGNWNREQPDYAVVLDILDPKRELVQLMGAMDAAKVESYKPINGEFWGIPIAELNVSAVKLYQALVEIKHRLERLQHLTLA